MRATLNGIGMEYSAEGPRTGLPVVLIHGFPFSKEMWKEQVELLKKECYVVTYDIRGHGASEVGDGQYAVEYFVDDLIALLDYLKLGSVVAVGLSMGGYIALRAIERNPERFRGLVLCDTRSDADGNEGKVKRAVQAKTVKVHGMKKFADLFLKGVFFEQTFESNPEGVTLIRNIIEQTSPLSVAGTLIALAARTDSTPSLYNIKVPTLILVGQHDTITPPSASHSMKERIPRAEMQILPRAAHLSNLENAADFNEALIRFLRKLR